MPHEGHPPGSPPPPAAPAAPGPPARGIRSERPHDASRELGEQLGPGEDRTDLDPLGGLHGPDGAAPEDHGTVAPVDEEGREVRPRNRCGEAAAHSARSQHPGEEPDLAAGRSACVGLLEKAGELCRRHPRGGPGERAERAGREQKDQEVLFRQSSRQLFGGLDDRIRDRIPGPAQWDLHSPERNVGSDRLRSREEPLGQAVADRVQRSERHRVRGHAEREERDLPIPRLRHEPVPDPKGAGFPTDREPDGVVGVGRGHGRAEREGVDRVGPLRVRLARREGVPRELSDHGSREPGADSIR